MRTLPPALTPRRRDLLAGGAALATLVVMRPARAQADDLKAAIADYTGGALVRLGRVQLEIAPLIDNGNVVPVTLRVDSPMTAADHVTAIALFNEKNPQRDVLRCVLGPRSGRAEVSTRIRLATSQQLVAVARLSDGSWWSASADVIVVLAACIES